MLLTTCTGHSPTPFSPSVFVKTEEVSPSQAKCDVAPFHTIHASSKITIHLDTLSHLTDPTGAAALILSRRHLLRVLYRFKEEAKYRGSIIPDP